jgi:hypothetical protein
MLGNDTPAAALQLVETIDRLTTEIDLSVRAARRLLKNNGIKCSTDHLRQALSARRKRHEQQQIDTWLNVPEISGTPGDGSGTPGSGTPGGTPGQIASRRGGTPQVHSGTGSSSAVPPVPRSIERYGDGTPPADPLDDLI